MKPSPLPLGRRGGRVGRVIVWEGHSATTTTVPSVQHREMDQEYPTVDEDREEDETKRSRHEMLSYNSLQKGRGRG